MWNRCGGPGCIQDRVTGYCSDPTIRHRTANKRCVRGHRLRLQTRPSTHTTHARVCRRALNRTLAKAAQACCWYLRRRRRLNGRGWAEWIHLEEYTYSSILCVIYIQKWIKLLKKRSEENWVWYIPLFSHSNVQTQPLNLFPLFYVD